MDETPISSEIHHYEKNVTDTHAHGSLHIETIRVFERLASDLEVNVSLESGCGKSTILFSNVSARHLVFCLDDRYLARESSVNYFINCPQSKQSVVEFQYGPTQKTLAEYQFKAEVDLALIDGPHGFPFPYLEYYYIYPTLRPGSVLIIDDIQIPSVRSLWEIVSEDEMFDVDSVINGNTGILRRTQAPTFNPLGDGWWEQIYNRRRVPPSNKYYLSSVPTLIE